MQDNVKELTLFDNYDFIERIESLLNGYESAEVHDIKLMLITQML